MYYLKPIILSRTLKNSIAYKMWKVSNDLNVK
jgi:hypothetical protein